LAEILRKGYIQKAYGFVEEVNRAQMPDSEKDALILESVPAILILAEALGYDRNSLNAWAEGVTWHAREREGSKTLDEHIESARENVKKFLASYESLFEENYTEETQEAPEPASKKPTRAPRYASISEAAKELYFKAKPSVYSAADAPAAPLKIIKIGGKTKVTWKSIREYKKARAYDPEKGKWFLKPEYRAMPAKRKSKKTSSKKNPESLEGKLMVKGIPVMEIAEARERLHYSDNAPVFKAGRENRIKIIHDAHGRAYVTEKSMKAFEENNTYNSEKERWYRIGQPKDNSKSSKPAKEQNPGTEKDEPKEPKTPISKTLTFREREILKMLNEGKTAVDVSKVFVVSEERAEELVAKVKRKTGS
jgi:hypothetical protein